MVMKLNFVANDTPVLILIQFVFVCVMILNHQLIHNHAKIANLIMVIYNRGFICCERTVIYQFEFMNDFKVLISDPPSKKLSLFRGTQNFERTSFMKTTMFKVFLYQIW